MTKRRLVCALCAVCTFLAVSDAYAFSWWKLNKLSGPEFDGIALEVRVKCWRHPDALVKTAGVVFSLCPKEPRRKHSISVNAAWFYSERDETFADNQRIYFWSVGGSFATRVTEVVELGAGAHLARFYSRGIESSFEKLMLEPVRVDLRLLQDRWTYDPNVMPDWWREAIVLRVGLLSFPQGFDPGEFNAEPDDDRLTPYIGLYLDLGF